MSTSTISSGISADEFQALNKILRAVEIVRRSAKPAPPPSLNRCPRTTASSSNARAAETELNTSTKSATSPRRVEKMLQQMDELTLTQ
jgi:hypothetical protein